MLDALEVEERAERGALGVGEIAVMALMGEAVLPDVVEADGGATKTL